MIYLSSSLALSALEVLVNLPVSRRKRGEFPSYIAVAVDVAGDLVADPGFPSRQAVEESRAFGDAWLRSATSLGLLVPSRVISLERNVLLNPRHPAMAEVTVVVSEPFVFDDRLSY